MSNCLTKEEKIVYLAFKKLKEKFKEDVDNHMKAGGDESKISFSGQLKLLLKDFNQKHKAFQAKINLDELREAKKHAKTKDCLEEVVLWFLECAFKEFNKYYMKERDILFLTEEKKNFLTEISKHKSELENFMSKADTHSLISPEDLKKLITLYNKLVLFEEELNSIKVKYLYNEAKDLTNEFFRRAHELGYYKDITDNDIYAQARWMYSEYMRFRRNESVWWSDYPELIKIMEEYAKLISPLEQFWNKLKDQYIPIHNELVSLLNAWLSKINDSYRECYENYKEAKANMPLRAELQNLKQAINIGDIRNLRNAFAKFNGGLMEFSNKPQADGRNFNDSLYGQMSKQTAKKSSSKEENLPFLGILSGVRLRKLKSDTRAQ